MVQLIGFCVGGDGFGVVFGFSGDGVVLDALFVFVDVVTQFGVGIEFVGVAVEVDWIFVEF